MDILATVPSLPAEIAGTINPELLAREIAGDLESDFIVAPHFAVLIKQDGATYVREVLQSLEKGYSGPRPPHTIFVPKTNGHFRPGSILEPFDRVVYHAVSWLAYDVAKHLETGRAISTASRVIHDNRTESDTRYTSWADYNAAFEAISQNHPFVLVLDIAHCFERVPQHSLVNLLQAEGLQSNAKSLTEELLLGFRMRNSQGILQGMLPSDYLGDLFLSRLDSFLEQKGFDSIRYVDDLLVGGQTQEDLGRLYRQIVEYLHQFGLQPNEAKTRIDSGSSVLSEHTYIDDLFIAAREEVSSAIPGMDIDYGLGLAWHTKPRDDVDVDLKATKALLKQALSQPSLHRRILKFVLKPLGVVNDPAALALVIEKFSKDSSLSREYARYLTRFASDTKVMEAATNVVASADWHSPYHVMNAVEVLRAAPSLPRESLGTLQRVYSNAGSDAYRALAGITIAQHGTGAMKQDLLASFAGQSSEYVRAALVFAAQHFLTPEKRTAKRVWAGASPLCADIAGRVL